MTIDYKKKRQERRCMHFKIAIPLIDKFNWHRPIWFSTFSVHMHFHHLSFSISFSKFTLLLSSKSPPHLLEFTWHHPPFPTTFISLSQFFRLRFKVADTYIWNYESDSFYFSSCQQIQNKSTTENSP